MIYYVDENDTPTGETEEKLAAHHDNTRLHAAFSCYIFRSDGRFLVTQRALSKKVWPGVWTNSCCGHPAPEESREAAIQRRVKEELGITVFEIQCIMPHYVYRTPPFNGVVEHEYCPVYVALSTDEVKENSDEVEDFKWVSWEWYVSELDRDKAGNTWSWWAKDQFTHLQSLSLDLF